MAPVDELDAVYATYELTRDGYRIVRKACVGTNASLLADTIFSGMQNDDLSHSLNACAKHVQEVTVISLWAVFENAVREHVKGHFACLEGLSPEHYFSSLHARTLTEVEYWKLDDLLDLLKRRINPNLVGQAKQIKQFRDWIAHGKPPHKATPTIVSPDYAWKVLRTIVSGL